MSQDPQDPTDAVGQAATPDNAGPESVTNLRPYGSLVVAKVTGEKPDAALRATIDIGYKAATSGRRKIRSISDVRRSPTTAVGETLSVQAMSWREVRPSRSFTDGRNNHDHLYLSAATDGEFLAVSTNSPVVARKLRKWIRSEDQGFVNPIADRVFRDIAAGRRALAAWLRNTAPNRHAQFSAMAVAGTDVGLGAVASDLTSYLASTVRVEHEIDDGDVESVTVNPGDFQLSFKPTDAITTWCDLVEVAFVWIRDATEHPSRHAFVSGTADLAESLDGVGAPYEVLLSIRVPDLPGDDQEHVSDPLPPVRFEVSPDQSPEQFDCQVFWEQDYVGQGQIRLRRDDDRWFADLRIRDVADTSVAPTVRNAVDALGIEVHFSSEYLYSDGVLAHRPLTPKPFRGYDWVDFGETDIHKEKPAKAAKEMRRLVGTADDDSLFGWATRTYTKGWLVCDDGAHETADFIHLTDDQLVLIPIKAASKGGRSTSTDAIHLVQAQASKNLFFLDDLPLLHDTLTKRSSGLVVFRDGVRQDDGDAFLDALAAVHPAFLRRELVIVQPQLQRMQVLMAHQHINDGRRRTSDLGMIRIDSMLRALDRKCGDLGIDFSVLGRIDPS